LNGYIEEEIKKLHRMLHNMYSIVKEVLDYTTKLFEEKDEVTRSTFRDSIEKLVNTIDGLRRGAFTKALLFIAKFQPLGRELKFIEAYINVCYDVYRIGRYCREISRVDSIIGGFSSELFRDLHEGLKWARSMVELAVQSFTKNNVDYARRVLSMDSRLDNLYVDHLKKLTSMETVPRCFAAKIVIARQVERIGDHATYIARYTLLLEQ